MLADGMRRIWQWGVAGDLRLPAIELWKPVAEVRRRIDQAPQ